MKPYHFKTSYWGKWIDLESVQTISDLHVFSKDHWIYSEGVAQFQITLAFQNEPIVFRCTRAVRSKDSYGVRTEITEDDVQTDVDELRSEYEKFLKAWQNLEK